MEHHFYELNKTFNQTVDLWSFKLRGFVFVIVAICIGALSGFVYGFLIGLVLASSFMYFKIGADGYILMAWGIGISFFLVLRSAILL
ncbi:uncharacterized protein MONOS_17889 [Monocercomonoides exilis]|uniref:uncharacterized protein n=1 Tax=Monocercomonoides exilis TaxID=2049356 RepID=UPI003559932B|nr:hypothetical protein MONOS_17889 [Monocercomonoides exilis]